MEFDYIIIGAGSAGCVLAKRLGADPKVRILVLEAGGSDRRFWIKMPLGYARTFADPRVNWCYQTQPDPGLNARVAFWPRGRVVGGSSSINAMAYVRGLARDYDDWGAAGATGWNWNTARAVFERLEHHCDTGRAPIAGKGPVPVADLSRRMHPFSHHFLKAAQDMGWDTPPDMNQPGRDGLSFYRSTVRHGMRCSAADAFLRPALKRGNVRLVTRALVERIELEARRAVGVRYRQGDETVSAKARREVLLCAGAVNSPQLLQLSGIGPSALLQSHEIDVVHALDQVGQGLQDHLAISQQFAATRPTLNSVLGDPFGQTLAGIRYVAARCGPLTVPVNQVGGFVRSDAAQPDPDMQLYCNPISYTTASSGTPRIPRAPGFLLSAQPCRPSSRGEILIASADPRTSPSIQPNALSTDKDRADAVRAGRLLQRLAQSPSLARVTRAAMDPDITTMKDTALLDTFRDRAATVYHPCCTCRMGDGPDTSVLNGRLQVHGLQGLRVVDASAFPNVTSGNTNAPVMMLAFRAADLIVEDARTRPASA